MPKKMEGKAEEIPPKPKPETKNKAQHIKREAEARGKKNRRKAKGQETTAHRKGEQESKNRKAPEHP